MNAVISKLIENTVIKIGNTVRYLQYDPSTRKNIYGESKVKKYLPPINFPALIRFNPNEEELEDYGMDKENVEVLVKIPKSKIVESGLNPSLDDKIEIDGKDYYIKSIVEKGRIEDNFILVVFGCNRGK